MGVTLSVDELDAVTQLRRPRNDLQHSSARFNQRTVLRLCRRVVIFIDRFVVQELNAWPGDVIATDDWYPLLSIEEIHARAVTVTDTRLRAYRDDATTSITACPRCSHQTMLRPHPNTGQSCVLCAHVPIVKD